MRPTPNVYYADAVWVLGSAPVFEGERVLVRIENALLLTG